MPSLLDVLGYAGNALDLPGSSVRDLLTGNNPFDQWLTPFSDQNRATGRDVLAPLLGANEETGMAGWLDNPMEGFKDIAGFGAEVLLDPTNLIPGRAVLKALKGRKAAKAVNAGIDAENLANVGRYGRVNSKILMNDMLPEQAVDEIVNPITGAPAPPKLLGYTPEREVVYHGGRDWTPSATAAHPYGVFDTGRLRTGEGNNAFGPGMYVADAEQTSQSYKQRIDDMAPEPNPIKMGEFRQKLDEVFTPGKEYSADEMNFRTPLDDVYYQADETASQYGGAPMGIRVTGKDPDGYTYDVLVATEDGVTRYVPSEMSYEPRFNQAEWFDHFGIDMDYVQPKGNLYQLDMPTGSKGRFMDWDASYNSQPQAAKDIFDADPKMQVINKFEKVEDRLYEIHNDLANAREKIGGPRKRMDWTFRPTEVQPLLDELKSLEASKEPMLDELASAMGSTRHHAQWWYDRMTGPPATGERMADTIMGQAPAGASLGETAGLKAAGVPGMKNLSNRTKGTYNYAIWDQDLINQMRVRAINGERVPINPTTLVQQQAVPARRGIADENLLDLTNPMREKMEVPNALKPAVAGAVFNLLARQNNYGGAL